MKRYFLAIVIVLIGCTHEEPMVLPPADISKLIASLPKDQRVWFSGLAFLDDRLIAATNIGLLEITDRQIRQLYRWSEYNHMMLGPWSDEPRSAVWVFHRGDDEIVRLERSGLRKIALPKHPRGSINRGEALYGMWGTSDSARFRVVEKEYVWRWGDSEAWEIEPSPPAGRSFYYIGIGTQANRQVHVLQPDGGGRATAFWYVEGRWLAPLTLPIDPDLWAVVSTTDGVFVRGRKGELIRLDIDKAVVLQIPGVCESISRTSSGQLIASFRDVGIFALRSGWVKLFDAPYGMSNAEHRVMLAENKGTVALARSAGRYRKPHTDGQWSYTGNDTLWVSERNKLERVELFH